MNLAGISDSLAGVTLTPHECPICHGAIRIRGGQCLNCLLGLGQEAEEEDDGVEKDFATLLSEIDLPDSDWRLGNYQILEEIGRGGMGVIYRARQRHSRRIVALKRVLGYHGDSRETLERFRREAQAAASLDHPNLLPIYEVSEAEGMPYFTMKYATGGTLQEGAAILRGNTRECVRLLAKVARAVAHAHREGILHRDLKPGNILLDGSGEPMVSDFGLAKWIDADSDLTRSLAVYGTPGFIAPEQASGNRDELTPAADVYSLGAILFYLLTGRPPFLGENALGVIHQAAQGAAPRLRAILPKVDRDLETICSFCLERDPKERYRSASDLAEDLERWLEGRPILARPVIFPVRAWRWMKRNPALAAAVFALLLLLGTAVGWQLESRYLAATVRARDLALHSVVVLPFLNLDSAEADLQLTQELAQILQRQASLFGACDIRPLKRISQNWIGIGAEEEVRGATDEFQTATALAGTVRTADGQKRISLHLLRNNGADLIGYWVLTAEAGSRLSNSIATADIAGKIYHRLNGGAVPETELDPPDSSAKDETARGYIQAGRGLLDRRTSADMDRAIACFEGAIAAAPNSVEALSYLALAQLGRNFLTNDPTRIERGFAAAQEAMRLAPRDSSANCSLAALHIFTGEYALSLEHAFRSLEAPRPSERSFGHIAYAWKMWGRPDKAIAWFQKAKETKASPDYNELIGACWAELGDDARAEAAFKAADRFRPDLPEGWLGLCHLRLLTGQIEAARQLFRTRAQEYGHFHSAKLMEAHIEFFARNFFVAEGLYAELDKNDAGGSGSQQYGLISYKSALARMQADKALAAKLVDESLAADGAALAKAPHHPEILFRLAAAHAIAEHKEDALEYLRKAMEAGWLDYRSAQRDPRFDFVRNEAGFQEIMTQSATRAERLCQSYQAELLQNTSNQTGK